MTQSGNSVLTIIVKMKIFNLFRDFLDNQILIPCFCWFNLQISVCDDYSLPLDYVKKRPSSLDPGLAECLPDNWPSPLSEHVSKLSFKNILFYNDMHFSTLICCLLLGALSNIVTKV